MAIKGELSLYEGVKRFQGVGGIIGIYGTYPNQIGHRRFWTACRVPVFLFIRIFVEHSVDETILFAENIL